MNKLYTLKHSPVEARGVRVTFLDGVAYYHGSGFTVVAPGPDRNYISPFDFRAFREELERFSLIEPKHLGTSH